MNNEKQQLLNMRHSAEHIMAQAILKLYPEAKMAMGPATEDGFYGDFEFPENISISPDDFALIEKEMQRLINQNLIFEQKTVTKDEYQSFGCLFLNR
ncbi:MAG: hypothetical protein AB7U85_05605 [Alphaproteobacteria bacterium]